MCCPTPAGWGERPCQTHQDPISLLMAAHAPLCEAAAFIKAMPPFLPQSFSTLQPSVPPCVFGFFSLDKIKEGELNWSYMSCKWTWRCPCGCVCVQLWQLAGTWEQCVTLCACHWQLVRSKCVLCVAICCMCLYAHITLGTYVCVCLWYRGRGVDDKSLCLSLTVLSASPSAFIWRQHLSAPHCTLKALHPPCSSRHSSYPRLPSHVRSYFSTHN